MNQGSSCPIGQASSSTGSDPKAPAVYRQQNNERQSNADPHSRVKRRKTKKERNSRFNQSDGDRFMVRGTKRPFVRKKDSCAHSSFVRVVPPFAIRGACNSNPIIITQGRLTHHMGLFHGEVKSIDIKRLDLLKDTAMEVQPANVTQTETDEGRWASRLSLTPITVLEDQEGTSSLKHVAHETHILGSKPLLSQNKEKGNCTPCTQGSSAQFLLTSPHSQTRIPNCQRQSIPVVEAAEIVFKMINSRSLFPGRNLVTETKKSILARLKQQQRMLGTNLTPLSLLTKLNYSHTGMSVISEGLGSGYLNKIDKTQTEHGRQGATGHNSISPFPVGLVSGTSPMHVVKTAQVMCGDRPRAEMDLYNQLLLGRPECELQGPSEKQRIYSEVGSHLYEGIPPRGQFSLMPDSRTKLMRNTDLSHKAMQQSGTHPFEVYNANVKWKPSYNDLAGHSLNMSETISPRQGDRRKYTTPMRGLLLDICTVPASQTDRRNWPSMAAEHGAASGVRGNIWNCDTNKSPGFTFTRPCTDTSGQKARLHYGELNSQRDSTFSLGRNPRGLGCQNSAGPERFICEDAKDSFHFLEPKRHTIHRQTAEIVSPPPLFAMPPSWNNIRDVRAESPVSRDRADTVWRQCQEEWPQRQLYTSLCTQPSEPHNLFVSHPEGGSLRQTLLERSSPESWMFPRMKLY